MDNISGIVFGDYNEQWKLQRNISMVILRNLGYGKNRLQEIITEEAEELCNTITRKEGEILDISSLLKYVYFCTKIARTQSSNN